MKKAAACLLAFCLCIQNPLGALTVSADTRDDTWQTGYENGEKATPDSADEKASSSNALAVREGEEATGSVQVEVRSVLVSQKALDLTMTLAKEDGEYKEERAVSLEGLTAYNDNGPLGLGEFSDLEPGRYELEVTGDGYETYRQTFEVKASVIHRIRLMNDYFAGYTYSKSSTHPGVLRAGDVNGDGSIDKDDLDMLLNAVHDGPDELDEESANRADLSGDGQIDLVDLQYFSIFYENPADYEADVEESMKLALDQVTATPSNAVSGAVEDILDGREDTALILAPENGADVSTDNPIKLDLELINTVEVNGITIAQPSGTEYVIEDGEITVEYADGEGKTEKAVLPIKDSTVEKAKYYRSVRAGEGAVTLTRDPDGTIVINLGKQVAVKKVSIKVTQTSGNSLAEISKVEFLNDMEKRIPAPVMNIPQELDAEAASKAFTLTWRKETNVTGYEVKIVYDGKTEKIKTTENTLKVTSFDSKKLKNGEEYVVSVQSVNGDWSSGYSPSITVVPKTDKRPDAPENVSIVGAYKSLKLTWKDMEDTNTYTIFYRLAGQNGEYSKVTDIVENKYSLTDLEELKEYEVYLTGTNEIGESGPSAHYKGTTTGLQIPITPNYKLINVYDEVSKVMEHIAGVTNEENKVMEPDVADGDYATSWVRKDWDAGVSYPTGDTNIGKSPIVTLDDDYEMDTVAVIPDDAQPYNYTGASVYAWTEGKDALKEGIKVPGKLSRKTDKNGKTYYEFQFKEPVTAHRIQINLQTGTQRRISIAEIKFYYYDSLESEVYGLYADEMHMTLRDWVTEDTIKGLEDRLNTPDDVSGELHPKKDILDKELENARALLTDEKVKGIIEVHTDVTKKADNGAITFGGGLNAWQPLGVTASAGENVVIYVGSPAKKTGDATNLNLIATQYHAESSSWFKTIVTGLKAGANEIEIPALTSLDVEQGGQLYVEYTGQKSKETYYVRVSGGSQVPYLDLTLASGSNAQRALVEEYVKELEAFVPEMEALHDQVHLNEQGEPVDYEPKNCVLGATDIVLKNMMLSVSSPQILNGLGDTSKTTEEKTEQLYQSLKAMENMIDLFYHSKGLSNEAGAGAKNRLPVSRLNIRYQRMFAGAFMYAGGLHIGIEWGSIPGLTKGLPVISDETGRYESGQYFGWGISHEIGHEINEGTYAIAEITNNYFSVLAQAKETNDSVRFKYEDVYEKVTSGVTGRASNVFTQLGLYWQLHLAYDMGGYNFKMYDSYNEQFDNLFFARVDTYARTPGTAPKPGNTALTLTGNVDNKLMRLACAAAEKNLLEFFERWGMVPDDTTRAYASQFAKEDRAIWFVNDEARDYVMQTGANGSIAKDTMVQASISYEEGTNQVKISLGNDAAVKEAMLGYEIIRTEHKKDQVIQKPVGFVTADQTEYTDLVTTVNNRVFTYEVVGYDKYLNPTKPTVLEPVKVSHGGYIAKDGWTVTTNMLSDEDTALEGYPCEPEKLAIEKIADGNKDSVYTGKAADAAPQIILNLNQTETVTGLQYTLTGEGTPITAYDIFISQNGSSWTKVKSGKFTVNDGALTGGTQTVYFNQNNDTWLYAYDAAYVKITAKNQRGAMISVGEFDLLGQTGDNVEIYETDGIGILAGDYNAGTGEGGNAVKIPAGSLIFTGTYKGNPAYNTVLLFDQDGKIVGGTNEKGEILASQMIFANVPEHGELGETSQGTWIYYIEPEDMPNGFANPKTVRAELYRVDDALRNQGERLVADTYTIPVPDVLPQISIKAGENER